MPLSNYWCLKISVAGYINLLPKFYSSHSPFENPELEKEREKILDEQETIEIKTDDLNVKRYDKPDSKEKLKEKILYILEARNEKGIDAFVKLKDCLYLLQFTIAAKHELKGGLESFFSSYYTDVPPSKDWKFVFIIDGSHTILEVPSTKEVFTRYSAIMKPENRKPSCATSSA